MKGCNKRKDPTTNPQHIMQSLLQAVETQLTVCGGGGVKLQYAVGEGKKYYPCSPETPWLCL